MNGFWMMEGHKFCYIKPILINPFLIRYTPIKIKSRLVK